jgi:hypothetical protein
MGKLLIYSEFLCSSVADALPGMADSFSLLPLPPLHRHALLITRYLCRLAQKNPWISAPSFAATPANHCLVHSVHT